MQMHDSAPAMAGQQGRETECMERGVQYKSKPLTIAIPHDDIPFPNASTADVDQVEAAAAAAIVVEDEQADWGATQ